MSSRQTTSTQGTQQQSGSQSGTQSSAENSAFTGNSTNTNTSSNTSANQNQFANQNQYDWQQMPDSQDILALRGYREQIDPSIGAAHSRRSTNLRNSFQNPLGQYTTAAMRDATQRSLEGELEQDYGQAQRQGYNDMQGRTGARLAGLASLTAPTLTQTGSTGTSSSTGTNTGISTDTGSTSGTSSGTSSGSSSGNYAGTGSNTGSTSQSTPLLPSILGGAASVGAAAL